MRPALPETSLTPGPRGATWLTPFRPRKLSAEPSTQRPSRVWLPGMVPWGLVPGKVSPANQE